MMEAELGVKDRGDVEILLVGRPAARRPRHQPPRPAERAVEVGSASPCVRKEPADRAPRRHVHRPTPRLRPCRAMTRCASRPPSCARFAAGSPGCDGLEPPGSLSPWDVQQLVAASGWPRRRWSRFGSGGPQRRDLPRDPVDRLTAVQVDRYGSLGPEGLVRLMESAAPRAARVGVAAGLPAQPAVAGARSRRRGRRAVDPRLRRRHDPDPRHLDAPRRRRPATGRPMTAHRRPRRRTRSPTSWPSGPLATAAPSASPSPACRRHVVQRRGRADRSWTASARPARLRRPTACSPLTCRSDTSRRSTWTSIASRLTSRLRAGLGIGFLRRRVRPQQPVVVDTGLGARNLPRRPGGTVVDR